MVVNPVSQARSSSRQLLSMWTGSPCPLLPPASRGRAGSGRHGRTRQLGRPREWRVYAYWCTINLHLGLCEGHELIGRLRAVARSSVPGLTGRMRELHRRELHALQSSNVYMSLTTNALPQ